MTERRTISKPGRLDGLLGTAAGSSDTPDPAPEPAPRSTPVDGVVTPQPIKVWTPPEHKQTHQFNVRIPSELYLRLRAYHRRSEEPMMSIADNALSNYLDAQEEIWK